MKFEMIKDLDDEKFRRLTGIRHLSKLIGLAPNYKSQRLG